ncbi:endonuclease [Treponema sp. OMZ 305]|uniref:endonuclease n=1 Tax=Treponema sp. OMZ 305 TaxID=1659192 RepID=UPI0020A5E45B|nr:endonuclease [Treponema sp. OMZ 305]
MPLDMMMTVLSIILMGGTVLFPDDKIHQILGMPLLVLWAVHIVLNRRWYGALFRGKYSAHRIMQIAVNMGILLCALFLMMSGLMMAWFVPPEAVGDMLGFARIAHLIASHWYYLFMCFHLRMHANMIASRLKAKPRTLRILRVLVLLISAYGVYAFISRGLVQYMFLQQQFFFFDFDRGYVLFAVDYLSILVLFAAVAHYAGIKSKRK